MIAAVAEYVSDAMLVIAALYVSFKVLCAYRKERKAEAEPDAGKKKSLLEDARTLYAAASLSLPWVLWCIFLGTGIKALLLAGKLLQSGAARLAGE
jgi:hypothetical protein